MNVLITAGTISLAVGAAAGWPVAMLAQAQGSRRRPWLKEPRRLMQLHIDWLMMGLLLLAIAAAIPDLPTWVRGLVTAGAIANPLLFVPLAVAGSDVRQRRWYRAAAVASFTAMTVGLLATAILAP